MSGFPTCIVIDRPQADSLFLPGPQHKRPLPARLEKELLTWTNSSSP